jgi:hypothetical protein
VIYRSDAKLPKASSVQTTRTFHPNLPLCREASNCSSLHSPDVSTARPDDTQCSIAMGFLSKTQIWENSCNRSDDVNSHSDALIHKVSWAFKIQTFGNQSSWSGRASYIYGNCMHQINRPNDHSCGPDARSLNMEIACSEGATVQTIGQHRQDAAQIWKEFQWNFGKPIAQLSVRTPYVYLPDGA